MEIKLISIKNPALDFSRFATIMFMLVLYWLVYSLYYKKQDIKLPIYYFIFASITLSIPYILKDPFFSSDIYRYIWEGKIQNSGFNPYLFKPNSEVLENLQNYFYNRIDHKNISAVYPPVTQIIFRFLYIIPGNEILIFKSFFSLFIPILIFFFYKLLNKRGMHRLLPFLALNPLLYFETSLNGHIDILGITTFIISYYFISSKPKLSAILITIAILIKYLPLIFIPFIIIKIKNKPVFFATMLLTAIPFLLPFIFDAGMLKALINYSNSWTFNGSLFPIINTFTNSPSITRIILLIMGFILFITILKFKRSPEQKIILISICLIVLSPVLFPWYLIWFLPFAVLNRNWAIISLSVLSLLSYQILPLYIQEKIWQENTYIKLVEYIPFYILLVISIFSVGINKSKEKIHG